MSTIFSNMHSNIHRKQAATVRRHRFDLAGVSFVSERKNPVHPSHTNVSDFCCTLHVRRRHRRRHHQHEDAVHTAAYSMCVLETISSVYRRTSVLQQAADIVVNMRMRMPALGETRRRQTCDETSTHTHIKKHTNTSTNETTRTKSSSCLFHYTLHKMMRWWWMANDGRCGCDRRIWFGTLNKKQFAISWVSRTIVNKIWTTMDATLYVKAMNK